MATNTYKMYSGKVTTVGGEQTIYIVPGATEGLVIGLMITNSSSADASVTIKVNDNVNTQTPTLSGTDIYVAYNMLVPKNSNFNVLNDNNRMVVSAADIVKVTCAGTGAGVDVVLSVMEIA